MEKEFNNELNQQEPEFIEEQEKSQEASKVKPKTKSVKGKEPEPKPQPEPEPEKINLEYITLLEEEEIDISDLSPKIVNVIKTLKALISRYKSTPTGNIYKAIIKKDLEVCDMIQNWLEEDLPEEELEEEKEEEKVEKKQNQQTFEEKEIQRIAKLKQAILSKMKNDKIEVKDLKDILGRHPNYPVEQIGDLKLRKNLFRSDYSVVK